ncbi:MAG: anhydro-N-acetylmuramic acid kinase [Anaerolineae bacterium]|nr:anhydro-N-acetylmuramic acid kinase [Anaerolineae bacterium]
MVIIGLMSGTSADGIDVAVVDVQGAPPDVGARLLRFVTVPWPDDLRAAIFAAFRPESSAVDRLTALDFALGERCALAARAAADAAGMPMTSIDLIASHGQTLWHAVGADDPVKSTLQLGQPAVIAERSGVTVVADFRVRDVAAGGQGAPLVGYTDYLLLRHATLTRAVQNIGGIANVTALQGGCAPEAVFAFDTGPGNMLIDDATLRATDGAQVFDRDGRLGAAGRPDDALIAELMRHPYFALPPPKTTGREQFGRQFGADVWERGRGRGLSPEDIVATVTKLTAVSIADAYTRYVGAVDEVVLCGGGADNPTLVRMIGAALPGARVLRSDDLGVPADAKEAIAFAVLAYETVHARPGNLPSVTGARGPRVLGAITPGDNFAALMPRIYGGL